MNHLGYSSKTSNDGLIKHRDSENLIQRSVYQDLSRKCSSGFRFGDINMKRSVLADIDHVGWSREKGLGGSGKEFHSSVRQTNTHRDAGDLKLIKQEIDVLHKLEKFPLNIGRGGVMGGVAPFLE